MHHLKKCRETIGKQFPQMQGLFIESKYSSLHTRVNTMKITTKLAQTQGLTELLSWSPFERDCWQDKFIQRVSNLKYLWRLETKGGSYEIRGHIGRVEVHGLLQEMENKTKQNKNLEASCFCPLTG